MVSRNARYRASTLPTSSITISNGGLERKSPVAPNGDRAGSMRRPRQIPLFLQVGISITGRYHVAQIDSSSSIRRAPWCEGRELTLELLRCAGTPALSDGR